MTTDKIDRKREELPRVLVIDDEEDIRELLDLTLVRMGLSADCAGTVAEAKRLLKKERYSLCLTDMRLPDGEGLEIVRLISAEYGAMSVAVITAFGSADNAVAEKPDDLQARLDLARHYIGQKTWAPALEQLLEIVRRDRAFGDDVGRKTMIEAFDKASAQPQLVSEWRRKLSSVLF